MFSDKSKNIADACRFCWMCRHLCPVGLVTGNEANTPRGRALMISMDQRGIPLGEEGFDFTFQCCLCGACTDDCATGYDPTVFTREARTNALVQGLVPAAVNDAIERAIQGNLAAGERNRPLAARVEALEAHAPVLLILGEGNRFGEARQALALMDLLDMADVSFTALPEEPACGSRLYDLIGDVQEVRDAATACIQAIGRTGARTVVVLDPTDARFLKHECRQWGLLDDTLSIETATAYVSGLVAAGRLKPVRLDRRTATYHDPCRLARDLAETEPARAIIAALGLDFKEMFLNRNLTKCCGGSVLHETNPAIAEKVAAARLNEAKATGAQVLITACPSCQKYLGTDPGMAVADVFELLADACRQV